MELHNSVNQVYYFTENIEINHQLIDLKALDQVYSFSENITIDHQLNVIKSITIKDVFCKSRKYRELLSLSEDDLLKKEKFITDWHALRFLERNSSIVKVEIARVLVSISNLLRECFRHRVDEINLLSIRIYRKGKYFIITEY